MLAPAASARCAQMGRSRMHSGLHAPHALTARQALQGRAVFARLVGRRQRAGTRACLAIVGQRGHWARAKSARQAEARRTIWSAATCVGRDRRAAMAHACSAATASRRTIRWSQRCASAVQLGLLALVARVLSAVRHSSRTTRAQRVRRAAAGGTAPTGCRAKPVWTQWTAAVLSTACSLRIWCSAAPVRTEQSRTRTTRGASRAPSALQACAVCVSRVSTKSLTA